MSLDITLCVTDEDYEQWRQVRIAVIPFERTQTVAELRAGDSPERLLLLAREGDTVLGHGLAQRAESAGSGGVIPRVLPEHRRRGVWNPRRGGLQPVGLGRVERKGFSSTGNGGACRGLRAVRSHRVAD